MMQAAAIGGLLAAVVAGPPLWGLVAAGSLDATTALERGALVALACTVGVMLIGRIVAGYARAAEAATQAATQASGPSLQALDDALDAAVAQGRLDPERAAKINADLRGLVPDAPDPALRRPPAS